MVARRSVNGYELGVGIDRDSVTPQYGRLTFARHFERKPRNLSIKNWSKVRFSGNYFFNNIVRLSLPSTEGY